jgi:hypothetical protein
MDAQGLGKGIISTEFKGTRFVAVGSELLYSEDWKTFHDFLNNYLKRLLGDWFQQQAKLPQDQRHQIARWFQIMADQVKEFKRAGEDVSEGWTSQSLLDS